MINVRSVLFTIIVISWLHRQVETKCMTNLILYLPDFDNKEVSDFRISSVNLDHLALCYRKCDLEARCVSFQYNRITKGCSLFAAGFNLPSGTLNGYSAVSGAKLFHMNARLGAFGMRCNSNSECLNSGTECLENTCHCNRAYSYDPRAKACKKVCTQYGKTLSNFGPYGLNECNTKILSVSGAEACRDACRNEREFICINSEYEHDTGTCNLCKKAWFNNPSEDRVPSPGWTFYHRNCVL